MKKKQTILIIHNYYQIPGGEDTVVLNEKKLLEDNGHKVILYSRSNSELKTMSKFRKLGLPFISIFNPRTYREVKNLIKKEQIDIVHVHNTLTLISPSVYYAALRFKVPVIQTMHNFRLLCPAATFYRDGKICEDCVTQGLQCAIKYGCYRNSKLQTLLCVINTKIHRMTGIYGKINYVCLTDFNKQKLLQLKQINPNKVFVKPNFVSTTTNEIIPADQRKEQYIFAGRLDKLKGIDILLKTWEEMGKYAPSLIICGTGPMEEWCKKYIKENNLNIKMMGFVSNEKTRQLIAESKAMILPTQLYEGFPMTIVEAFSVGTPVIGSDIGNTGNLIVEGETGSKFKQDSPEELVLALERLKRCKNLYSKVVEEYRDKYVDTRNYNQLKELYNL